MIDTPSSGTKGAFPKLLYKNGTFFVQREETLIEVASVEPELKKMSRGSIIDLCNSDKKFVLTQEKNNRYTLTKRSPSIWPQVLTITGITLFVVIAVYLDHYDRKARMARFSRHLDRAYRSGGPGAVDRVVMGQQIQDLQQSVDDLRWQTRRRPIRSQPFTSNMSIAQRKHRTFKLGF